VVSNASKYKPPAMSAKILQWKLEIGNRSSLAPALASAKTRAGLSEGDYGALGVTAR
jgi:hypothetical protein